MGSACQIGASAKADALLLSKTFPNISTNIYIPPKRKNEELTYVTHV